MTVKKTISGKISMDLTQVERDLLHRALFAVYESSSQVIKIKSVVDGHSLLMHLVHTTLASLLQHSFALHISDKKKIIINRPQSLTLVFVLRMFDDNATLLELKSRIHKLL